MGSKNCSNNITTFKRGSDGKCIMCNKVESGHYGDRDEQGRYHAHVYCYEDYGFDKYDRKNGACCECVRQGLRRHSDWNFDANACDQCKNRQRWKQEQAEAEAKREAEAEAKRKKAAEAEAKRKAEAEAERKKVGLAPSASNEELAQAQKLKAYIATPSGSQMNSWLLHKGIDENDVGRILLQFIKPEYEVTTLLELFALEDQDIDEVLQGLPLAKRKVLKASIKQDRDGI